MKKNDLKSVEQILRDHPNTRDDDNALYFEYMHTKHISVFSQFYDVLHKIKSGEMLSMHTIARYSRLIQRNNKELRGINYSKRKQKEKEVKAEIIDYNEQHLYSQ
jgi:predicted CopG family antitoxin